MMKNVKPLIIRESRFVDCVNSIDVSWPSDIVFGVIYHAAESPRTFLRNLELNKTVPGI